MSCAATIVGWGKALPSQTRTNADLSKLVDTDDEWIVSRTGIRERRIASDHETTFTLARDAADRALQTAGLTGPDVDLVIVATLTPEYGFPSTASLVQEAIGATTAGAFDLNAACAGFAYGLAVARGFIESEMYRTIVLIGSDTMSRVVDWTDRSTCVLFGDGAGAVVVQRTDTPGGIASTCLRSDGSGGPLLIQRAGGSRHPTSAQTLLDGSHYLRMNGREVYRFAVTATTEAALAVMVDAGWTTNEVDLFIPHQANVRIIESAARSIGIPMDHVFVNADRYGNTSAGSIPIALCEALDHRRIQVGSKIVTVGFGAGLAWAAHALTWTTPTGSP